MSDDQKGIRDIYSFLSKNASIRDLTRFIDKKELFRYSIKIWHDKRDSNSKWIISHIIKYYSKELFTNEQDIGEFIGDIFLFEPVEVIEFLKLIHDYCSLYTKNVVKGMITYNVFCNNTNSNKWRSFAKLNKTGLKSKKYDLLVELLYANKKKMRDIIDKIKSNEESLTQFIREFRQIKLSSLSSFKMSKKELTDLVNISHIRDKYYSECDNIIYYKCIVNITPTDVLIPNHKCEYGHEVYYIKNRYISLKTIKSLSNEAYEQCIRENVSTSINISEEKFEELFYHQHRRDKLDVNKFVKSPMQKIYDIYRLFAKFNSKNLTRLSGYFI